MSDSEPKTTHQGQPSRSGSPPGPPQKASPSSGDHPSDDRSKIRAVVPEAVQNDVMSYLNLLSGVITNIELGEHSWTFISAILPTGYLRRFKQWLHEFSKGQAQIVEEPS
jgi:hypothetical protein